MNFIFFFIDVYIDKFFNFINLKIDCYFVFRKEKEAAS